MQTCIKCKRIDKAIEFYEEIKCYKLELDVVAFQTIISGCIYNGKLEKAMMIVLDAHDIEVFVEKDIYNNLLKNMLNAIHGHRQRPIDFSLYERVYNSIRSNKIFGTSSLLESLYNSLYTNQRVDNRKYMQRSKY
jgi:pentatricopeptide repeat protein